MVVKHSLGFGVARLPSLY